MKRFNSIQKELAIAGVPRRILKTQEVRGLVNILGENESILGCVQGLYSEGIGLIVATNSRLLIINKSFLWTKMEDESYAMINSILYKKGLVFGQLTLATRARRYMFNVLKRDPIEMFIEIIDAKMRQHGQARM